MTLIRICFLYPSIHNSLIANTWIEVKLAQHMMCAFGVNTLVDADFRALVSPITSLDPQNK
jgi:hypothetical protein